MQPTHRLIEWANSNAIVTTTTIILAPELEALLRINIPFVGSAVIGDSGTLVCWLAKGDSPSWAGFGTPFAAIAEFHDAEFNGLIGDQR